jgi:hypothetical protein
MSDFFKAFIPVPCRILGVKLRPISIGSLIILNHSQSPFTCGGLPSITDLMAAVFICSQTFKDALEGLDDPKFPKFISRWSRKAGKFDFSEKVKLFSDYMKDGTEKPVYDWDDSNTFSINAPGIEVLYNWLLANTTLTETEILDRPFALSIRNQILIKAMRAEVRLTDTDAVSDARCAADSALEALKRKGWACPGQN